MPEIDKSKGLGFTIHDKLRNIDIEFYRGLYSNGSFIASAYDKEIYLSSPLCKTSKQSLKEIARMKIWEVTGIYIKK